MKEPQDAHVFCVDIGSTKEKNFAWCTEVDGGLRGSTEIEELIEELDLAMRSRQPVALGFEAPLYIPVPKDARNLGKGRPLEKSHPWSQSIGATAGLLGLHQCAWILRSIRSHRPPYSLKMGNAEWTGSLSAPILYCWEAFVCGDAHSRKEGVDGHLRDAANGLRCFRTDEGIPPEAGTAALSLIGTAALWTGWLDGVASLREELPLVFKPTELLPDEVQIERWKSSVAAIHASR
jgi:hypothetical protein